MNIAYRLGPCQRHTGSRMRLVNGCRSRAVCYSVRGEGVSSFGLSFRYFSVAQKAERVLNIDGVNEHVKQMRYEVRGQIYLAALKRIKEGKRVIFCNIGNPHQLGQKPITFPRQVLSLLMAPFLLDNPNIGLLFPPDAIARAKTYLKAIPGGLGAYSDSKGVPLVRQEIVDFIKRRDGVTSDEDHIFLSNGASEVARHFLQTILKNPNDGVMVPIPQYPLYSAGITLCGGELVPYYLDETKGWSMDMGHLQNELDDAKAKGIHVKALVYINPGNPTGQCLTEHTIQELIAFCHTNKLVLCADEAYQENIYNSKFPFVSARKALSTMPEPYPSSTELVSFYTVSKGFYGECGLRGGYMELLNIDEDVMNEMYKMASVNLSPNIPGQVAVGLMCNPPKEGDPSYAKYIEEKTTLLAALERKANKLVKAFNSLQGVSCQPADGAMYVFPNITIPPKAMEKAAAVGKAADVMYCLELLDETGICCVPGSGFKQLPGTFHIRTTILPPEEEFDDIVNGFRTFHVGYLRRYK